ncbi:MAG TPA: hypothetical protein VGK14_11785 [Novimethylophilus sp.]|jgi:hypothetical protein|uniref:hypothetical protein n=1 Tax=Novimethylophilus sp. TaxID=2137426 RepID=UPI002F3FBAA2
MQTVILMSQMELMVRSLLLKQGEAKSISRGPSPQGEAMSRPDNRLDGCRKEYAMDDADYDWDNLRKHRDFC